MPEGMLQTSVDPEGSKTVKELSVSSVKPDFTHLTRNQGDRSWTGETKGQNLLMLKGHRREQGTRCQSDQHSEHYDAAQA